MSKKIILEVFFFFLVLFLIINVYSSQALDPLFFNLVTRLEKKDAVTFLKKIEKTEDFVSQLAVFQRVYSQSILSNLEQDTIARKKEINQLEAILTRNPKARDALVKLAILYFENDNRSKAKEYYQQAKTIDPEVKVNQLEQL